MTIKKAAENCYKDDGLSKEDFRFLVDGYIFHVKDYESQMKAEGYEMVKVEGSDEIVLANTLGKYVKDKHTQEECIGFIDGFNQALAIGREQGRKEEWERCEKLFSMIKIPHEPTYTKEFIVSMLDTLITEYAGLIMDAITTESDIDGERLFDVASPPKTEQP